LASESNIMMDSVNSETNQNIQREMQQEIERENYERE